jgi:hypothetical protein
MRVCFSSPLVRLETRCDLHDICSAPRACPQTFAALTVAQSPGPSAGATECDIEVHTEGGLGGHCGAIEDEVLLEKREAGERSVTGRGPTLFLLCHRKVEKRKEKWVYNLRVPLSLSVAYTVPILSLSVAYTVPILGACVF